MRKISRAAKDQESRLRADLREMQCKLEVEQKYAEKVREEREELRQAVKRQKLELGSMEVKIKALEADASKKTEGLRVQVIDAIQRSVEKCTRKYVDSLDNCFPSGTYIFTCDEGDSPADADQGEAASQQTQNSAKKRIESANSAADDKDDSESSELDKIRQCVVVFEGFLVGRTVNMWSLRMYKKNELCSDNDCALKHIRSSLARRFADGHGQLADMSEV